MLYWAAPGAIYRANMDGTNQSVLVDYDTPQPDGMELDIIYDRYGGIHVDTYADNYVSCSLICLCLTRV